MSKKVLYMAAIEKNHSTMRKISTSLVKTVVLASKYTGEQIFSILFDLFTIKIRPFLRFIMVEEGELTNLGAMPHLSSNLTKKSMQSLCMKAKMKGFNMETVLS